MKEDLLHEAYAKIVLNEPKYIRYIDRLDYLFYNTIRDLFRGRKQVLYSQDGCTSSLNESSVSNADCLDFISSDEPEPIEVDEFKIDRIKMKVFEEIANDNEDMKIFVMSQMESYRTIASSTGKNPMTICNKVNKVRLQLRKV